jgi:hypothetical protein
MQGNTFDEEKTMDKITRLNRRYWDALAADWQAMRDQDQRRIL